MKGLTLTQPWASLVALGHKSVETRSWTTQYRGLVAIHAAKGFPSEAMYFTLRPEVANLLAVAGMNVLGDLPRGVIVAVARLTRVDRTQAMRDISEQERTFGDYTPGRYAWMLADVIALPEPVPCRGALSLWALPPEVEAVVRAAWDADLRAIRREAVARTPTDPWACRPAGTGVREEDGHGR